MTANYCADCGEDLQQYDEPAYCPGCGTETGLDGAKEASESSTSTDIADQPIPEDQPGKDHRSPERKLKALIEKDIDPEITRLAERALEKRQEEST